VASQEMLGFAAAVPIVVVTGWIGPAFNVG